MFNKKNHMYVRWSRLSDAEMQLTIITPTHLDELLSLRMCARNNKQYKCMLYDDSTCLCVYAIMLSGQATRRCKEI